jgi:hypothetical protein
VMVSQLIWELQELKKKHGDIEVVDDELEEVSDVEFNDDVEDEEPVIIIT